MKHHSKHSIHDIPFQRKIMLSFLLILLLPMIFIVNYTYHRFVYGEQVRTEEQFHKDSSLIFDRIDEQLSDIEVVAEKIASNPVISNYFNNYEQSPIDNVLFAHQYFSTFVDWLENFSAVDLDIHFYTRNESLFESKYVSIMNSVDSSELQQWMQLESGDTTLYWRVGETWPAKRFPLGQQTDQQMSFYTKVVPSNFFHPETFLALTVTYAELFKDIQTINPAIRIQMNDLNGNVLFSSNSSPVTPAEIEATQNADNLISISGQEYLLQQVRYTQYGLEFFCFYPQQLINNNSQQIFLLFLICLLALIGFFVLITYLISRSLSHRLLLIADTMHSVGENGLNIRVPVIGRDEIGQLAADFNKMMDQICVLNEMTYQAELLRKDATIKALESEIDPHFLFNALQTIGMMAEIKDELAIADAISSLGAVVRYNLSHGNEIIPLEQELEHIQTYCALQNLILNDRLRLQINIPTEFRSYKLLRMCLTPLVENCILHGFRDFSGICQISISLQTAGQQLRIIVRDNGNGIEEAQLMQIQAHLNEPWDMAPRFETSGNGIALKNVHQRIRLKYGMPYGLEINSCVHQGTWSCVTLPIDDTQKAGKGDQP